jgi:hypothetical protein
VITSASTPSAAFAILQEAALDAPFRDELQKMHAELVPVHCTPDLLDKLAEPREARVVVAREPSGG